MIRNVDSIIARGRDIRAGSVLVDGQPWSWASSAVIEIRPSNQVQPTAAYDEPGNMIFQFEGFGGPGLYARRFAVQPFGSVSLQVAQFPQWRLRLLSVDLSTTYDVVVYATDGEEASSQPLLLYPETVAANLQKAVPWGAVELIPAQADAGFRWQITDASGTLITVPQALVAGSVYQVAGLRYFPSVPFSGVWRIRT